MKKQSILILVLAINSICFGQIKNENELTGKWNVEKIINKPTEPQFKQLVDSFEKSTFYFKQNKQFELTTTNETELFKMMMTEGLSGGTHWKFDNLKQLIKVGSQDNGFSIMLISVKTNNEKLIFHIEESNLNLLLKKTE